MKSKLNYVLLGVTMMLRCTRTVRFYPVQGPLAAQTPPPVPVAKLPGAFRSGNISVTRNDGEVCTGRWTMVPRPQTTQAANTASAPATTSMSSVWDTVYGQGFYVSHVLAAKLYARAVLTGDRGTTLNVEMYRPERGRERDGLDAIKGVARDNKDNIYKLVFY